MSAEYGSRTIRQRVLALGGLVGIVGVVVGVLLVAGVLGTNNDVEAVELLNTPASDDGTTEVGPSQGKLAPNFEISDFDNDRYRLSDFRGQAVYINFWATWCVPCQEELPDIEKLADEYGDGLAVIVVNRREPLDRARDFLEKDVPNLQGGKGVDFEVAALDPDDTLYEAYRGLGMPTSVFVAPDGVVSSRADGIISYEEMQAAVEAALGPS